MVWVAILIFMKLNVLTSSNQLPPESLFRIVNSIYIHMADSCCDRHDLGSSVAFTNPDYPDIQNANCVFDVSPTDTTSVIATESVVNDINELFGKLNLKCQKWTIHGTTLPADLTDKLQFYYGIPFELTLLQLHSYQPSTISIPGLQIISARSVMSQYHDFLYTIATEQKPDNLKIVRQWADWNINILDNNKLDILVARQNKQIISAAGVVTSGENGVIFNHLISKPLIDNVNDQSQFVLFEHLLNLCARAQFKNIIIECPSLHTSAISFYTSLGFKLLAHRTIFVSPEAL